MGQFRKVPAGTTTRPPPALLQAAMALRKASVQSNLPSPLAPYFVAAKSRFGKTGGLMRFRISGTRAQGSSPAVKAGTRARASASADDSCCKKSAPAPLARVFLMKSLRSDIDYLD